MIKQFSMVILFIFILDCSLYFIFLNLLNLKPKNRILVNIFSISRYLLFPFALPYFLYLLYMLFSLNPIFSLNSSFDSYQQYYWIGVLTGFIILAIWGFIPLCYEIADFFHRKRVESLMSEYGIEKYTCKFFDVSDKKEFNYEYVFRYFKGDKVFYINNLLTNEECTIQDFVDYLLIEFPENERVVLRNELDMNDTLTFLKCILADEIIDGKNISFDIPLQNRGVTVNFPNNLKYRYDVSRKNTENIVVYGDDEIPSMNDVEDYLQKIGEPDEILSIEILKK